MVEGWGEGPAACVAICDLGLCGASDKSHATTHEELELSATVAACLPMFTSE